MKYTLKPYQEVASDEIMARIARAQELREIGTQAIFSLYAPTGAGKTVIATDVFERLLIPGDNSAPDEKAAILWFSDGPDLNTQSRYRIEKASSELMGRTVEIDSTFQHSTLEPGRIYFLNTQKIGKGTKLAGGSNKDLKKPLALFASAPDQQQLTIWDILRNTINSDDVNLYFVVDEAHRGAGKQARDHRTILRRLVEGHLPEGQQEQVPPMPVVMGISATPGKFKEMVDDLDTEKTILKDVVVPAEEVQETGLLKDIIDLRIPDESGSAFDGVFVREAAALLRKASQRWDEYHQKQGGKGHRVVPLMVVQVADLSTGQDLYEIIESIWQGWPDLSRNCFAHVFGDHSTVKAGDLEIPHVPPQTVEDNTKVRVLFAKSAISTGWDCPRAEVLVSFRPAQDRDYITQIIGRMVRSPLARRIPGDDLLNSVLCLLPKFNKQHAIEVVNRINIDEPLPPLIEFVVRPETLYPIDNDRVWDAFCSIQTEIAPKRSDRPISRLINLGVELEYDRIKADARAEADDELVSIIDGLLARHKKQVTSNIKDILKVGVQHLRFDYLTREEQAEDFVDVEADERVISKAYDLSLPIFTRELAGIWVKRQAASHSGDDIEDALIQAQLQLAALGKVEGVKESLWRQADQVAAQWMDEAQADIALLSDERQGTYVVIREMAEQPSAVDMKKPSNRSVAPGEGADEETYKPYERYAGHVLVGEDRRAPAKLNAWERAVVTKEQERKGAIAWYRNPSRPGADTLSATYYDEARKRWRNIQPDFLFFREDAQGEVRPSIIDPHGSFLSDSLDKLRGLAQYTSKYGDQFVQVLSLSGTDADTLQSVDLKDENVRSIIEEAASAEEVFQKVGRPYV